MQRYLLFITLILFLVGCAEKEQLSSQTLILSLNHMSGKLQVVDYEVQDNTYAKSKQQGRYQAHLFGSDGTVLQKINFEKIDIPLENGKAKEIDFYVSLPLIMEAQRVEIYQLDGRSGHYQLKTDNPLLNWSIPEDIKQHARSDGM